MGVAIDPTEPVRYPATRQLSSIIHKKWISTASESRGQIYRRADECIFETNSSTTTLRFCRILSGFLPSSSANLKPERFVPACSSWCVGYTLLNIGEGPAETPPMISL
mmetsp:Transcript_30451/g.71858  ORF Transcript_30451/g.71858 Transcript_30451/m.71858 type:complete len:108 (+) Transcript_30451:120-443(+)